MTKTILNLLTTFDGFVAGLNDQIDWIGSTYPPSDNPDIVGKDVKPWDFSAFTSQVGAIIVGRRSFDIGIEKGWFKNNAYGSSPIFVVCKQKPETASKDAEFHFITEGIEVAHKLAVKAANNKFIYIFGGPSIIQQLLDKDLLDEMWITVAPILLGKGIRLFDNLSERRIDLQQLKVEAHPNSMYEVHYRILKTK
ncbi:hypothetical protein EHQ92_09395 [Leptospira biflexa]|uniref:dihydrofolate reductase family protein n=1 Tax=Leptospira biflexa TaxID=172 RepID=UPI001090B001|nr:dihydrofolate reductase family protein [Leptospira biflexa]TGM48090.1 hypothetical protein EHQ92_09395 [Leptospira biflexa]TGM49445.1 hypothetical protein EHQ88_03690 [Leptospira biflexa]